jgi:hypothetical protein
VLIDGSEIELKPGGKDIPVTWATRHEFCDLMEHAMLHAYDRQVAAIRRGFATLFPISVASCLLGWRDIEVAICSEPRLDIPRLREHSSHSPNSGDAFFEWFWAVVAEFTVEE